MAYLFSDGFDQYTTLSEVWDTIIGSPTISSSFSRFSPPSGITAQGVQFAQSTRAFKNLPATAVTLILGVAFRITSALPSTANVMFGFYDGTSPQVTLFVTPTGALEFWRGSGTSPNGTQIGAVTAGGTIVAGIWHYAEIIVTFDPTAGVVQLYLDGSGTAAINSSGLNTRNTANSFAGVVLLGDSQGQLGAGTLQFDDLYCFDTTTGSFNAKVGDNRIITKMPSGAGGTTQWTNTGAATNWQCVNEIPPNEDTSYVSSNTPGTTDYYATQSGSLAGTVNFLVVRRRHRKDDAATHTDQSTVNSSSSIVNSTAVAVGSSYTYQDDLYPTDPHTSAAWTASAADAVQIGLIETS